MKLFISFLLVVVSISFAGKVKEPCTDTLSVKKKLNGKDVSFVLVNKKIGKKTVCFNDDFYHPDWEMESISLKVNDNDIFLKLNVLYCLWQNISSIDVTYKDGYYVLETFGGDGGFTRNIEFWFDDDRIIKTIMFANGNKTDTLTVILHKEVVYD